MPRSRHELQDEFDAAFIAATEAAGPNFDRGPLIADWRQRGVGRTTIYRWIDAVLASGQPSQHLAHVVKKRAAERAQRVDDPSADVAMAARATLPAVVNVDDIASRGAMRVIDQLNLCTQAANDVLVYARTEEGKVRAPKMMLQAAETFRRCLETAARITETMHQAAAVERFQRAIMDEIAAESPALAERVLMRLQLVSRQWGA